MPTGVTKIMHYLIRRNVIPNTWYNMAIYMIQNIYYYGVRWFIQLYYFRHGGHRQ